MVTKSRQRIGEILVQWGALTQQGVNEALEYGRNENIRIGEALIALGLVDEEDVTKALASQYNMEYIDLDQSPIDHSEMDLLTREEIQEHQVLPVGREDGKLKIIITDPLDLEVLDMLRFRLGCELLPCLASAQKVRAYIKQYSNDRGLSMDDAVKDLERRTSLDVDADGEQADLTEESATIIRLVTMILSEALNRRASDVHVEPMSNRVRLRYRIDGVCVERPSIPKRMQGSVINRLKLLADMDLAQKRLPQDGRIKLRIGGQDIDFRVSVLPSYHGQSVVLRILRPESVRMGIEALGFEQEDMANFQRIIRRPNGIFLVTGPTGSGKTTTLYAAMNELNRPDRKIITAEDPVEYNFPGINQVQINESIGLTFKVVLRSMLRQAPNIILIGEIRDKEVADIAIQSALTGHLVFSTLHTNDAPSAITRLIDMGVKPFLVASSIQAIMSQRLVRKICEDCKEVDAHADPRVLRLLGFSREEIKNSTFYHGQGCTMCNGTGYIGRQGIFEMLEMNSAVRDLAFKSASVSELRRAARAGGMRTLLEDGKRKILAGITTTEELVRIAQSEDMLFED